MAKKGLLVSADDQIRYESVQSYLQGEISLLELASVLKLTERQTYRVVAKVKKNGLKGVFHGNHGRAPKNKSSPFLKKRVQEIVRTTYFDFNCLHIQERLLEDLQLNIKRETLRSWCKEIGVAKNKRRQRRKPRPSRQRHCNRGFLLQMDGSHHEWVAGQEWVLISVIDDATSELHYCQFHYGETTNACLSGLRAIIERLGVPRFIYVDRAGLYGGQKRQNFSEFERVCNELGIKIIYANSPQGKGRIERTFRTFQDRLIPELRLRKITDMGKANLFLNEHFIPKQWGQFTVEPASALEDWRPVPEGLDLNKVFSILKHRKVNPGETISLDTHSFRVTHPEKSSLANQTALCASIPSENSTPVSPHNPTFASTGVRAFAQFCHLEVQPAQISTHPEVCGSKSTNTLRPRPVWITEPSGEYFALFRMRKGPSLVGPSVVDIPARPVAAIVAIKQWTGAGWCNGRRSDG